MDSRTEHRIYAPQKVSKMKKRVATAALAGTAALATVGIAEFAVKPVIRSVGDKLTQIGLKGEYPLFGQMIDGKLRTAKLSGFEIKDKGASPVMKIPVFEGSKDDMMDFSQLKISLDGEIVGVEVYGVVYGSDADQGRGELIDPKTGKIYGKHFEILRPSPEGKIEIEGKKFSPVGFISENYVTFTDSK